MADATPGTTRVTFTYEGVQRGFARAQPLAIGVLAYGVTFGLLADEAGLSILEAALMSAVVYSGSAQVATVGTLTAGGSIVATLVTVVMLNARYLLYGASLRPWLGQTTPLQAYGSLYFIGDASWLLSMKAHADGERDAGFVFGAAIAAYLPWVGGTILGAIAGDFIAHPEQLALDFLLIAFCAAMAVGLFKSRADLTIIGAALVVALAANWVAASAWTIVLAGIAGALTAYLRHQDEPA